MAAPAARRRARAATGHAGADLRRHRDRRAGRVRVLVLGDPRAVAVPRARADARASSTTTANSRSWRPRRCRPSSARRDEERRVRSPSGPRWTSRRPGTSRRTPRSSTRRRSRCGGRSTRTRTRRRGAAGGDRRARTAWSRAASSRATARASCCAPPCAAPRQGRRRAVAWPGWGPLPRARARGGRRPVPADPGALRGALDVARAPSCSAARRIPPVRSPPSAR